MANAQRPLRWIWLIVLVVASMNLLLSRLSGAGIAIFFVAVTFGLAILMIFTFRPDSKK